MNTSIYKQKLENLRSAITNELETIAIHRVDVDDWVLTTESVEVDTADTNDHADIAEDSEERIAILSDLKTRYRNIVRALQKIEEGTYGICEISNEPIELDRLEVHPAARTCKKHLNDENQLPQ
jgi:RNA polymerase-binding transcription factor DksA